MSQKTIDRIEKILQRFNGLQRHPIAKTLYDEGLRFLKGYYICQCCGGAIEKPAVNEGVLEKLKNIDWDCFYRGSFYACCYYTNSGDIKSKEYIGKTLNEALTKMLEDIDKEIKCT